MGGFQFEQPADIAAVDLVGVRPLLAAYEVHIAYPLRRAFAHVQQFVPGGDFAAEHAHQVQLAQMLLGDRLEYERYRRRVVGLHRYSLLFLALNHVNLCTRRRRRAEVHDLCEQLVYADVEQTAASEHRTDGTVQHALRNPGAYFVIGKTSLVQILVHQLLAGLRY